MIQDRDERPKQIGPYKILKRIGGGGMGDVYKAVHVDLKRTVALKVLKASIARDERILMRFKNEARAAAIPSHENIVIFYEHGEEDGNYYLALEYIQGKDLQCLLEQHGKYPIPFTLHVVKQAAKALQHAHKHGIVHRDIKPSNLLITKKNKTVKLTDMGLARKLEEMEDNKVTRDGYTLGTVDYMAPEQAKDSHKADIRSDLYSLGCTWYHLVTGEVPFGGKKAVDKLYKHAHERVPDVRDHVPEVPEDMAYCIQKLMEKEPENRYQNPAELLADLDRLDPERANSDFSGLALLAQAEMEDSGDAISTPNEAVRNRLAKATAKQRTTRPVDDDDDDVPGEPFVPYVDRPITETERQRRKRSRMKQYVSLFIVGCAGGAIVVILLLISSGSGSSSGAPDGKGVPRTSSNRDEDQGQSSPSKSDGSAPSPPDSDAKDGQTTIRLSPPSGGSPGKRGAAVPVDSDSTPERDRTRRGARRSGSREKRDASPSRERPTRRRPD